MDFLNLFSYVKFLNNNLKIIFFYFMNNINIYTYSFFKMKNIKIYYTY